MISRFGRDWRADRISSLKRRKLGAGKHDKQLFANEATFEPIVQILQNRFTGFDDVFFDVLDFQRPDWICGSFPSAFKLAGLVEIAHSCIGGEPFSRARQHGCDKE